MTISLQIQPEFGYVVLTASGAFFLNMFQMIKVASLRKANNIKYPAMSSEKHPEFNRAQRVHQNTMESVPFFLSYLLFAGLRMPTWAAGFGAVWVFGRFLYSVGYYSDVKKRLPGFLISQFGGLFPLVGLSIYTASGLIGWY